MDHLTSFELIRAGVTDTQANCPSLKAKVSRRIGAAFQRVIEFCSRIPRIEVKEVTAMVTGEDDVRVRKASINNKLWRDKQILSGNEISTMTTRRVLGVHIEAADLGPLALWRQFYGANGVSQETRELPRQYEVAESCVFRCHGGIYRLVTIAEVWLLR